MIYCEETTQNIIEASIEENVISLEDGTALPPDIQHNYTNGGKGRGLIAELSNKDAYFFQTDLNDNLIAICDIFIDNLNFTAVSTDPLVLEIKDSLELIKTKLQEEKAKIA
jgi:hypothetical protein